VGTLLLESEPAARPDGEPWFGPLLAPHRARIEGLAPFTTPRSGLGGAIVAGIASAYAGRRWQEAARIGITGVEGVDRRVHDASNDPASTADQLRDDAARLRRVWDALHRRESALLDRVVARVTSGDRLGDDPLPEAVLYLRGAVAAGVVCGAVDDSVHATLDRVGTWLGLAMEAAYGALTLASWAGAVRAVGLDAAYPANPFDDAVRRALIASSSLPDSDFTERLDGAIRRLPRSAVDGRAFRGYAPRAVLAARPIAEDPLEQALSAIVATDSRAVQRAVTTLQGQGGKRVRPAIVRAAAAACGGSDADALVPAALLEWLHQASLVVDDILDEARVRRGVPTLHHATDAPFALGIAGHVLARLQIASRSLAPPVRAALFDAASTLAEGQRQELAHTGDDQLPIAAYYRIIEAKTARLFGCAAVLGARTAGATESRVSALARYGREAGLAFQIVDDVLDYVGDERSFGKRPGTDLRAGKVTLPLLLLRDRLDSTGRDTLAAVLRGTADARRTAFPWVIDRMRALDIEGDALSRARVHRERAIAALVGVERPEALVALANRLVERRT
jgi:octaprenyl-diphosphate synthase